MATADGDSAARVALFAALGHAPWSFDFFQALRRIEGVFPDHPRLGTAIRPADEPLRMSQEASVAFAPSTLSAFDDVGPRPRLEQRFFGLLGPNGPLPLHVTEYVRERMRHHGDETLARFIDVLHHRFALFFYRAWASSRPTVQHDRPADDRFAVYVSALAGYGSPAMSDRDAVTDAAKRYFIGHLARHARNAEGLAAILEGYFGLPARVDQFALGWLELEPDQHTVLRAGPQACTELGRGAVLGRRVRDAQSRFRIVMGPMDLDRYTDLLPGARGLARLVDWVRNYVGFEFDWDVRLVLACDEVPGVQLGREGRLGWTTWLGARRTPADADDLTLSPERAQARERARAVA